MARDIERPGIFISYRRADSGGHAGRLSDSLQVALSNRGRVFMDVDTIDAGVDFVNALDDAVEQCEVFYALIGPTWVESADAAGVPRLSDPTDWVRREIATALSRDDDVRVVPVLVGGASLPTPESLPLDLQALVRRQAFELHATSWRYDVDKLVAQTLHVRARPRRKFLLVGAAAVVAIAAIVGLWSATTGSDDRAASATTSPTTAELVQPIASASSVGDDTDGDPRAQIVKLTGAWSVQGFAEAIYERNTDIVDRYLKSGLTGTTLHKGASAILYGFEDGLNGDPVALVKTFQANGYQLDDQLVDGRILQSISDSLPMRFDTKLTPKDYTGGYFEGKFTGSLLFWIVSRAVWGGATDEDRDALKYLMSQGADCTVATSFLDFNRDVLADTTPFQELYPLVQQCAR